MMYKLSKSSCDRSEVASANLLHQRGKLLDATISVALMVALLANSKSLGGRADSLSAWRTIPPDTPRGKSDRRESSRLACPHRSNHIDK
mmetsp:Transcript_69019/g.131545  ORF Transcript_69019/g.131545 Transcript_69019/m.131545 type:complete len:89 (+) Transcript_69019:3-269(+)